MPSSPSPSPGAAVGPLTVTAPIPWQSYYIDCTGQPPQSEFVRMLVAQVFLLFICLSYYLSSLGFIIFACFYILASSFFFRALWATLFLLMVGLVFLPVKRSDYVRNHWTYRSVSEYFQFRLISATKLPKSAPFAFEVADACADAYRPDKRYITTYFPHGVVSFGSFNWGTMFDIVNPAGAYGLTAVASVVLKLPFIRQVFGIFGLVDSSYHSLLRTLKKDNIALIPGGVAELFLVDAQVEKLYLKQRKGFCRLALQAGASIIPQYVFNHTTIFSLVPCVPSSLSRKLGSSLVFFWPLIPRKKQLILARGDYVQVEQVDNPTEEQVNALHEKVTKAVIQLFEHTKKMCGPEWENKELEIY